MQREHARNQRLTGIHRLLSIGKSCGTPPPINRQTRALTIARALTAIDYRQAQQDGKSDQMASRTIHHRQSQMPQAPPRASHSGAG